MTQDTDTIILATEGILTLLKMAAALTDFGTYRHARHEFYKMLDDLGRGHLVTGEPDWNRALGTVDALHTAACVAKAWQAGSWQQAGATEALSRQLISTAAVFGITLNPEDEIARRYAEGHEYRSAAE